MAFEAELADPLDPPFLDSFEDPPPLAFFSWFLVGAAGVYALAGIGPYIGEAAGS